MPKFAARVCLALLLAVVLRVTAQAAGKQCGGLQQRCCLSCPADIPAEECEQRECSGGRTCHVFGLKGAKAADGSKPPGMNVCLQSPKECGKDGQPCCYVSDAASEADRCSPGLACIVNRVGYGDYSMYAALLKQPDSLSSTDVMGTCRNVTKLATCGKRFSPCGAAARRLGCQEASVQCSPEDFCASPADTMLGASRCLPLPARCGLRNNACCPANKGSAVREWSVNDPTTAVPTCSDGVSFCLWRHTDYGDNGLKVINDAGGGRLIWDGYFQRGYGLSRCAPLPLSCGNPGEPCCPSMQDQRISGMVHNKRFKYQPCNYNAAGKVGVYCKGAWQGELLSSGAALGTCTLNTADCGKVGKQCCREDVPESGSVSICESSQRPGSHYCTADNVCTKCPDVPVTKEQRAECRGVGQQVETGSSFSGGGEEGRIRGARG